MSYAILPRLSRAAGAKKREFDDGERVLYRLKDNSPALQLLANGTADLILVDGFDIGAAVLQYQPPSAWTAINSGRGGYNIMTDAVKDGDGAVWFKSETQDSVDPDRLRREPVQLVSVVKETPISANHGYAANHALTHG